MPVTCAVHGKERGEEHMDEITPGVYECRSGGECKVGDDLPPQVPDWDCEACGTVNFGSKGRYVERAVWDVWLVPRHC